MSLFDDNEEIYDTQASAPSQNEPATDSDEEEPVMKKSRGESRKVFVGKYQRFT